MITKKFIFGYTPLKWYTKHFIRRMDCVFSNCFFFTLLRNFWNFLKEDTLFFFPRVFSETLTVPKSIFSSFKKKKIRSIFFPYFFLNLILDESLLLYWGFYPETNFKKKKGYQYNWRQLPFLCVIPPLFFRAFLFL